MNNFEILKLPHYRNLVLFIAVLFFTGCIKETPGDPGKVVNLCASSTPIGDDYEFDLPFYFPDPQIPQNNPMKVASVNLGRFLFWDKKLSGDNSMSCGTCHAPEAAFAENISTSVGIDGVAGNRNAMALINLVFQDFFVWDGRALTLEEQALEPVENPIEMHETWSNAVQKIEDDPLYDPLFTAAYGSACVDSVRITKSIAQFVRTLVSSKSKYDKWKIGQAVLTPLELEGLDLWQLEGGDPDVFPIGQFGADCFHCHLIADGQFRGEFFSNNGLDSVFTDLGRGEVTGNPADYGKFKIPTLRNIEYSFPYMHDGRFNTLEEVIEHYNTGGNPSPTVDPFMKFTIGGLDLTPQKKAALVAFLKTLSDPEFINNPDFSDPH